MQKNTNRLLSKIVFTCLIINTLPVHLPMYGSALPKGQELVTLKQEINRDFSSIKKTVSTLKKLRIIVPSVIIGAGVVAAIAAFAAGLIFFVGLKKILSGRFKATKRKIEKKIKEIVEKTKREREAIDAAEQVINKERESLKKKSLDLIERQLDKEKMYKIAMAMDHEVIRMGGGYAVLKDFSINIDKLDGYAKAFLQKNEIGEGFKQLLERLKKQYVKKISTSHNMEFVITFNDYIDKFISDVSKSEKLAAEKVKKLMLDLIGNIRSAKIDTLIYHSLDEAKKKTKKEVVSLSKKVKKLDAQFEDLEKAYIYFDAQINAQERDALKKVPEIGTDPSEFVTKNKKNIIAILLLAVSAPILAKAIALAGIAIAGLSVAIVIAGKKVKRLEALEEKYPGILTLPQRRMLKEFKDIMTDPKMQALIKNVHLRAALSKIVDEALKQHPSLVAALGGAKKASADFKKYAERKWAEAKLQRALDVGVGKLMAFKMKAELGITRAKLRSKEKKLSSKIEKAQLDVTKLKTALSSTAQSYIQQADAVLEDLKKQLAEAIEAGKLDLQKTAALPVIEL